MPKSDEMVEKVYDLVNRQQGEARRLEVARAAKLAAEFRAQQLARTHKAIAPAEPAEREPNP